MNLCIRYSAISALASALFVLALGLILRHVLRTDTSGGMAMVLVFGLASFAKSLSVPWSELFHFSPPPSNDIERATQMAQAILFGLSINAAIVGAAFGFILGRYRIRSLESAITQESKG